MTPSRGHASSALPLRLVITADDLGLDPKRDEGIFAAHAASGITQASLMVAGPSAMAAAVTARRAGLPLGLHLDLTELPPSAPPESVASLLDAGGHKLGKHGLRAAIARGAVDPAHVARETEAQIEAFARLTGAPPSHVDGHQHVHIVPELAPVVAAVLAAAGVRTTRIPEQRRVAVADPDAARFYRGVSDQGVAARAAYADRGVRSTFAFAGLDLMGTAMTPEALRDALLACEGQASVELMCHPGLAGDSHDDFNRSPAREHELRILCRRPFADLVAEGRIALAAFADLEEGYGLC
jgi:predicted glycoside hydrolase/deacetylase ChbG (UPF0249 family)